MKLDVTSDKREPKAQYGLLRHRLESCNLLDGRNYSLFLISSALLAGPLITFPV